MSHPCIRLVIALLASALLAREPLSSPSAFVAQEGVIEQSPAYAQEVDLIQVLREALGEIAALREGNEIDAARELIAEVVAGELDPALLEEEPDQVIAALLRALDREARLLNVLEPRRRVQEELLERLSRQLVADDLDLINAKEDLAVTRRELGDLEGAHELCEHVHAARERLLPADHSDLLTAKLNLAVARRKLGDLEGARELGEHVHAAWERLLPADHPDLLAAKLNLAVTRKQLGDLKGAHELSEHVHAARERLLPSDHPELLRAKGFLAVTRLKLGDLDGAHELHEYVHAARERLLPADHPDLLRAKGNLAIARRQLGDLEGARELCEYVHTAWERVLPAGHPNLIIAKGNLAGARWQLGDLEGAHELFEQVHVARERLLPADHTHLLTAKGNLAVTRMELGDLEGAHELFEHVHAARERLLPADHTDLLTAKLNLAMTRRQLGDLEGAGELIEHVHAARERLLPADHTDLLSAKSHLAMARRQLGDLEGAGELIEQVHAARERLLPADHPDLLSAKLSLATAHWHLGDFEGARELYEHVHAARERLLPADHPDLLSAKLFLAIAYWNLDDREGAHEFYEHVHAARERLLPADHPDLLSAKSFLAIAYWNLGDREGAHDLYEHVHAVRERLLPADHRDLLSAKLDLAMARRLSGDHEGAHELLEHVHAARERVLPADHPDLLIAKLCLAIARKQLDDLEGARAMLRTLLTSQIARLATLRAESPRVARAGSFTELQRFSEALFLGESTPSAAQRRLDAEFFSVLESLRVVSTSSSEVVLTISRYPELKRLHHRVTRARREVNDYALSYPTDIIQPEEWRKMLVKLTDDRDRIERELRSGLAEKGVVTETITARSVAKALGEGSALVSFLRYQWRFEEDPVTGEVSHSMDSLLAFVVTPDANVLRIELGAAEPIEASVNAWRSSLVGEGGGVGELSESGDDVRRLVLDPILAQLPEVKTLHVISDDFLHTVPLDALPLGEGLVGDRYALRSEATVLRLVHPQAPPASEPGIVLMGGVDYDAELKGEEGLVASMPPTSGRRDAGDAPLESRTLLVALEHTEGEVEMIGALFERRFEVEPIVLTGAKATKAELLAKAPGARYLHWATHGWFAPESFKSMRDSLGEQSELRASLLRAEESVRGFAPETLCGLAFAGANRRGVLRGCAPGILTAEELAGMDLSGCELAVLSACETNVGLRRAGQGIQSLKTALHAAGVRTAVTSLWRVPDAATRLLMGEFYRRVLEDAEPKARALWAAKMWLRGLPASEARRMLGFEGEDAWDGVLRELRRRGVGKVVPKRSAPAREEPPFTDPYYWAGWVLTGNPDG